MQFAYQIVENGLNFEKITSSVTDLNDCLYSHLVFVVVSVLYNRAISVELKRNCVKEVSLLLNPFCSLDIVVGR